MSLTPVLLGLGSNVQREPHLHAGLDALAELLVSMRCSPVFESLAVGYKGDNFYNLVVAGDTELPLTELDRRLKFIEADNGRYAPDRKGLPLDIDVLLYGELVGNFHGLLLPRAEILKNAFVLWPLALLARPYGIPPRMPALPSCGRNRPSTNSSGRCPSSGAARSSRPGAGPRPPAALCLTSRYSHSAGNAAAAPRVGQRRVPCPARRPGGLVPAAV